MSGPMSKWLFVISRFNTISAFCHVLIQHKVWIHCIVLFVPHHTVFLDSHVQKLKPACTHSCQVIDRFSELTQSVSKKGVVGEWFLIPDLINIPHPFMEESIVPDQKCVFCSS